MPAELMSESVDSSAPREGFLRRTVVTASTRLLDLPTRYGFHFLIAARLPIAEVGAFYIVFSVMTLASGFGRLGVDRSVTREVAAALGRDLPQSARVVIKRGFLTTLSNSAIMTVLLLLVSRPIAVYVLHKPGLAWPLALGAISILPQNVANAAAGALAGLGRVATSQMIYQWLWPALFCVAALSMKLTVNGTLMLIVGCMMVNAAIGIGLMLRVLPTRHPETVTLEQPSLFRLGLQLFSLELLQLAISTAPPFVLGIVATTTDVGRYALAWRLVLMLNLLVSAMGAIASPQFARASAIGDTATLRRVASQSVGFCTGLSILPAILLAINPAFFLVRFGADYAPAGPVLRVLLLGQIAMILSTAVPEMLGMTGHAKTLLKINGVSLLVLLAGLIVLPSRFGDVGAATATALAMTVSAIAASWAARRDLGIVPLQLFLADFRGQLRKALSPATASESPSDSVIQDIDNS